MRRSRLPALAAPAAAASLLVVAWQVLGSAHAAEHRAPMVAPLRKELAPLERMLSGRPVFVRPLPTVPMRPLPGACYAGLGECSQVPCVQFAAGASPGAGAPGAVLLRLAIPRLLGRGLQGPASPSCPGRLGMPKVLRVSAR